MREDELRQHAKCDYCNKLIGHTGLPGFITVELKTWSIDLGACRRQDGLAQVLGGSHALAQVMGPQEEMAKQVYSETATCCMSCLNNFPDKVVDDESE